MRYNLKKTLSYILTIVMILVLLPVQTALAVVEPSVSLGSVMLTDGKYYYANANVSGVNIRTILISFSDSVTIGDEIILPAITPTGFTVSASSESNKYTKRINLDSGIDISVVQDYLRAVGFTIASSAQSVIFTITMENITQDTFYNIDSEHYYQYISATATTWTAAYSAAKDMSYMGRTGYLATVMSKDEDVFLNSLSGGKTGWLGGTILKNSGTLVDGQYYTSFDTTVVVAAGWYWACGPEIGTPFYDTNSLNEEGGATAATATTVDERNAATYFNWSRGAAYEPNNQTKTQLPSHQDYETCLTTLQNDGHTGKQGTVFTWNDSNYSPPDPDSAWAAKGYFVEYGDELLGDSGSAVSAFASDSGTLHQPSGAITLSSSVTWASVMSYTRGVELPGTAQMVTISVNSGYFTVPSLGGGLAFLGGTDGTSYISAYGSDTHFDSAVFSFADVPAAQNSLCNIVYTPDGTTPQTITATSSTVAPQGNDIYFGGHYYRYIDSGSASIDWPSSVTAAGATEDPYFGGRGYIATAISQAENSILLRLVENGEGGTDHWDDVWMGGLWQRNTGSVASPTIIRGTDSNEITYQNLVDSTNKAELLKDYSITFGDIDPDDPSTFILTKPDTEKYYWIDGPEAGEEIANNTDDFAPWHATGGQQDEPNTGDFIYIGWQGAYWDDFSAYKDDTGTSFDKLNGYIVEFSGFDGGTTAGIVVNDSKTTAAYSATINTRLNASPAAAPGNVELKQGGNTVTTAASSATGVYTTVLPNGTYDIYINNEDTGENIVISGAAGSATVNYYTVAFGVADDGAASGSTVSATAGGTPISSGAAVLSGKTVVITAVGAGANTYTYLWSGTGTDGETTAALNISALSGAVNATSTVTGSALTTYTVSGIVSEDGGDEAQGALITIRGNNIAPMNTTADVNGDYSFSAIPTGEYNIIATYNGVTRTILIKVTDSNVTNANIAMPSGGENSVVEIVSGTPDIVVGNLEDQLTDEDGNYAAAAGNTVEVKLTIEEKSEPDASGASDILDLANGKIVSMYLDMTVTKTKSGAEASSETLSSVGSLLKIIVPYDLTGKTDITIYRVHNGNAEAMTEQVYSTVTPSSECYMINSSENQIILWANRFSTYAVAYSYSTGTDNISYNGNGATGGSVPVSSAVAAGTVWSSPGNSGALTKTNYSFNGWALTASATAALSTYTVNSDTVFYAMWAYTGSSGDSSVNPSKNTGLPYYINDSGHKVFIGFAVGTDGKMKYLAPNGATVMFKENPKNFTDTGNHWAISHINFVTEREIFLGTGNNLFSPDTGMTRAMFATVLGRIYERSYGALAATGEHTFTDCDYNGWYGTYIDWSADNGIITGMGGGLFEPNREITRQEMAVMLYRFAKILGASAIDLDESQLNYPDTSDIASWATEAAVYCQQTGIITGRVGGYFASKGTATRAEVAAILERFIESIV